jgi:hypothetical protein
VASAHLDQQLAVGMLKVPVPLDKLPALGERRLDMQA